MPTYLNSNTFSGRSSFSNVNPYNNTIPQLPCPLIYEHIKLCQVCQQAVKNSCSIFSSGGTPSSQVTIDKNALILYGIFFLFLIILILVLFRR